jgi:hypothetical protein
MPNVIEPNTVLLFTITITEKKVETGRYIIFYTPGHYLTAKHALSFIPQLVGNIIIAGQFKKYTHTHFECRRILLIVFCGSIIKTLRAAVIN